MANGLLEWFGKKAIYDGVKSYFSSDKNDFDQSREDRLYDTFVEDYDEFEISANASQSGPADEELKFNAEIFNLEVLRDRSSVFTALDIKLNDEILNHIPNQDDRFENAMNFWLQKDDVEVRFNSESRIGPYLIVYIPSAKKSQIKISLEAVRVILYRVISTDFAKFHSIYLALDSGMSPDELIENDEIEKLVEDLGQGQATRSLRYLVGSFAGHDPESPLDAESDNEH